MRRLIFGVFWAWTTKLLDLRCPKRCGSLPEKEEFATGRNRQKGRQTKFGRVHSKQTTAHFITNWRWARLGYINAKNRFNIPSELPVPHGEISGPFIKFTIKVNNYELFCRNQHKPKHF